MAKLLLFDPDLREFAALIGKIWGIGAGDQRSARTLKDFAAAIHKSSKLDEAVFFYHGFPGGIMLDGKGFAFSDKALADALTAKKTTIDTIRFEGCWVGERPDEMTQFGTYFKASQLSGFTWEGVHAVATQTVAKGSDAASLRKLNKNKERWFAPGSPTLEALAARARSAAVTEKILVEWYEYVVASPIKPPYETEKGQTKTNFERLGSKQYKRRSEADKVTIKFKDTEESSDPVSTFKYVTVRA